MRVALVTLEYPPHILGGAGVYAAELAPELAALGVELHVLAPGEAPRLESSVEGGVSVHRLPPLGRRGPLGFWAALPLLFPAVARRAGGFDLVHGSGVAHLTLTRHIAPLPRVITAHHLSASCVRAMRPSLAERLRHPGGELGLVPALERLALRRTDQVVAVSRATRNDLVSTLGLAPERIAVIGHGARPELYRFPSAELAALRAGLGIAGPLILSVGRLEPRKGVDLLLRALALLPRRDVTLVLAGAGEQAPYRELAEQLGVGGQVRFAGRVDDLTLRRLYAACDLVAFPSRMEGLGLVALEARAAGRPVVATRVGGLPEVVPEGAGALVPPEDAPALATAIADALARPHRAGPPVPTWREAALRHRDIYSIAIAGARRPLIPDVISVGSHR